MSELETFPQPGKRIIVEGNDGTGKSTVADMLAWQIRQNGYRTLRIDEPNSPIDDNGVELLPHVAELRREIKDGSYKHNAHADLGMFNVARFLSWTHVTRPQMLEEGVWPVQARDKTSSDVYQGNADGLGMDYTTKTINDFMDDELYFHADFKTVLVFKNEIERLRRIKDRAVLEVPDTFESRGQDFQQRVNEGYLLVAERDGLDLTEIDADQSREEVTDIVFDKMVGQIGINLTKYSWKDYWASKEAA